MKSDIDQNVVPWKPMMNFIPSLKYILFSFIAVTNQSIFAQTTGFFNIRSQEVSLAIREKALQSVFQVVRVSRKSEIKTEDITDFHLNNLSGRDQTYYQILKAQLERCKLEQIIKCSLWRPDSVLTGFTLGDSRTLITALHGFKRTLDSQARLDGFTGECTTESSSDSTGRKLPSCHVIKNEEAFLNHLKNIGFKREILLFNANSEIVYDSTRQGRVKIPILPDKYAYEITTNLPYPFVDPGIPDPGQDYLVLEFPVSIAPPLKVGRYLEANQNIVLAGYPMETKRENFLNSTGVGLLFSQGQALTLNEAMEFDEALEMHGYGSDDAEANFEYFILTNVDAVPRFSGGPYLNEDGEAVGQVKGVLGGYLKLDPKNPDRLEFISDVDPVNKITPGSFGMGRGQLKSIENRIYKHMKDK